MIDLELTDITEENLPSVLSVELYDFQRSFLPSIESSIELARNYPDSRSYAVSVGGEICGFTLYGIDDETGSWKIFRIYIDREFQSRGLGKSVTQMVLDRLEQEHDANEVLIVCNEENKVALILYDRIGFKEYDRKGARVLLKINTSERRVTCS